MHALYRAKSILGASNRAGLLTLFTTPASLRQRQLKAATRALRTAQFVTPSGRTNQRERSPYKKQSDLKQNIAKPDYSVPPELTESQGDASNANFREDFQGTRVFVENLPPHANWQDVKDHFRIAGEVVYASVSIDNQTGESKQCGIVQFETTEDAKNAIKTIRDHPMDGSVLYVREDRQERSRRQQDRPRPSIDGGNRRGGSQWSCANGDEYTPSDDEIRMVERIIQRRDQARKRRDYDTADDMREELKNDYKVHLDDRLKLYWWASEGRDSVPEMVAEMKGGGSWKAPNPWRQIPTTAENDACVDADAVMTLLQKRDRARREKDFDKADGLLEEARTAPDGHLYLRIHDESRTWRIWTDERPTSQKVKVDTNMSPYDQCVALIREAEPSKEGEVVKLLESYPGREWNILKKLKQRYS